MNRKCIYVGNATTFGSYQVDGTEAVDDVFVYLDSQFNVPGGTSLTSSTLTTGNGTMLNVGGVCSINNASSVQLSGPGSCLEPNGGQFGANGGIQLGSGSSLVGGGTINGDVFFNSGPTLGPGHSIDTVNVVGNTTITLGTTTEIEITNDGQSDRILVTGTADIEAGSTLRVIPLSGQAITGDKSYDFLTADGGINGEFTILDTSLVKFTADVVGNAYYIYVSNQTPFYEMARTSNQKSLATSLDETYSSATGYYATVLNQILALPTGSDVRAAYDLTFNNRQTYHTGDGSVTVTW